MRRLQGEKGCGKTGCHPISHYNLPIVAKLAVLAPAMYRGEYSCGKIGSHQISPCNLFSVPVRR